jgi:hypothetical protein
MNPLVRRWLERNPRIVRGLVLVLALGIVMSGVPRMETHAHALDDHAIAGWLADHGHDHANAEDAAQVTHVHAATVLTATLPSAFVHALPVDAAVGWHPAPLVQARPSIIGPPPYRPPIA